MMYKEIVAVCSESSIKHSMQSEHHVELFNIKPGATYRGAVKSLARPRKKQATATKPKFFKPLEIKIRSLSVQPVLRGSNDHSVGRKNGNLSIAFSVGWG